ncbi:helix-hairpin-helix domain-containing protein [Chryseolinea sp. T2]|uniref:helix-hairpin-helix domain-containing protein n=1 Tax=Chryseolinea sp. T2 TaxID=3129255 RepID=UPI003076FA52
MSKPVNSMKAGAVKDLMTIPGVGKSIATDLWNIGITKVEDLKKQDPDSLFDLSNRFAGVVQDRCLLYVFRCAVYYAEHTKHEPEKLKWWNWKDKPVASAKKAKDAIRR